MQEEQTSLAVTIFSEILVQILEIGYEVILNYAYPSKMWVHSSLPFWEKKKKWFFFVNCIEELKELQSRKFSWIEKCTLGEYGKHFF